MNITVFRKPLNGTVAECVMGYSTGGLNIDACRVDFPDSEDPKPRLHKGAVYSNVHGGYQRPNKSSYTHKTDWHPGTGRWPTNVILQGTVEVTERFPHTTSGAIKAGTPYNHSDCNTMGAASGVVTRDFQASSGSASRFFYQINE